MTTFDITIRRLYLHRGRLRGHLHVVLEYQTVDGDHVWIGDLDHVGPGGGYCHARDRLQELVEVIAAEYPSLSQSAILSLISTDVVRFAGTRVQLEQTQTVTKMGLPFLKTRFRRPVSSPQLPSPTIASGAVTANPERTEDQPRSRSIKIPRSQCICVTSPLHRPGWISMPFGPPVPCLDCTPDGEA